MYRGLWETDEGYVQKTLEMDIFSIETPLWNLEAGSFTRDFGRLMKGALEMERLCLRVPCEANLEGESFTGDPKGYAK